jgi:hypothetical protein
MLVSGKNMIHCVRERMYSTGVIEVAYRRVDSLRDARAYR